MTTTDLIVEVAKTLDATRQQEVLAFARRLQARGVRPQRSEVLTHMRRLAEGAGRDFPSPWSVDDVNAELDRDRHDHR